ncbi:MAG: hypothetical protein WCL27_04940 [Betaproteobacteria bacterium]
MNNAHDSVELRDEHDNTLLIYSGDSKVSDHNGHLGNFRLDYLEGQPRWIFCGKPLDSYIVLGPDQPSAAVEISKRYLKQLFSTPGGQSETMLKKA